MVPGKEHQNGYFSIAILVYLRVLVFSSFIFKTIFEKSRQFCLKGKWDHDMYYKLLEEAPRAKAPRVPNESWSTMGRRKPGAARSGGKQLGRKLRCLLRRRSSFLKQKTRN